MQSAARATAGSIHDVASGAPAHMGLDSRANDLRYTRTDCYGNNGA